MDHPSRIQILSPDTAERIAAGEVIERPASVLRELLDNALDAGATDIDVEIEGGGIGALRVTDNGSGMNAEELSLAVLPHATSKIRELDDLLSARTLGFRGEALASIASVARLDIVSAEPEGIPHRLSAFPGQAAVVEAASGRSGTSVRVEALFDTYPARKRFLKRPASESALCKQALTDKALPFPHVSFRLNAEGKLALFFPKGELVDRVAAAYASEAPRGILWEVGMEGPGFEGRAILGDPALARTDRRHTQVFVNGRRVQEYGFLQALDWAFSSVLPGGEHPFAFLFLDMDPSLLDFNIHPAKREVRFRDAESPRRAVSRAIQESLRDRMRFSEPRPDIEHSGELWGPRDGQERGVPASDGALSSMDNAAAGSFFSGWSDRGYTEPGERAGWDTIARLASEVRESGQRETAGYPGFKRTNPDTPTGGFQYLGPALGVFLVYEEGEALWLLDQHAAHERILFDHLMEKPPVVQELLVPLVVEPESAEEEAWLGVSMEALRKTGYVLEKEDGQWLVTGIPSGLRSEDAGEILKIIRDHPTPEDLLRRANATTACRAAIKDGDTLDRAAAEELIARARALPEPRCPHGRPIRIRFGKDELYKLVKRLL